LRPQTQQQAPFLGNFRPVNPQHYTHLSRHTQQQAPFP